MTKRAAMRSFASAIALTAALLCAAPAMAQGAPEEDVIVVTGSRIHTDPLTQSQPVTRLSAEDLARTGLSSTADILQRLPVAGGGLNTRNNNSGNIGSPPDGGGVGAGSADIDLRFLSPRRSLVLVDGLRWVNGTAGSGVPGAVDVNTIPSSMIQRIEVLQESAAPIYGSDAISGVVNIITRDRQDGLEASAQVGGYYEEGDGKVEDYSLTWGLNIESTHIVVGANYQNQELVSSGDRALSRFPDPYGTACTTSCSSGTPNGRFVGSAFVGPGLGGSITLIEALAPGVAPVFPDDFKPFTTADRFNFSPFNYLQTPSERFGAFGSVTHDFNNHVSLRVRGSYTDRRSANQAAPLPLFIGPAAGTGTDLDQTGIDGTNPFNPFGTLDASNLVFIGRRMVEAGPRHFEQEVETWNVTATLSGEVSLFSNPWDWDVNYVTSENSAEQSFTGNINVANVGRALGPVALCTAPCVPLNIFGGDGTITQAMLNYIGYTEENKSDQKLRDFSANITGDLFDMPAGPLSAAVGYEHREVEGSFTPDPITAAGLSSDIPALPSRGEFDVDEFYGELRIPLASEQPGFYSLEATLAGRYFNYSTFGSDSTYQAGLRWRPVEQVLLRGSWGEGFRAPSIGELFGSPSRFDQNIFDACNDYLGQFSVDDGGRGVGNPAPANIQTNCAANGVPGGYIQFNSQLPVFTRGNETLQPETSESWNVGVVWRPSFMESASFSESTVLELNYTEINLDQAIQAKDSQAIIDLCAETGDSAACATISRASDGSVRAITNPLINVGGIEASYLDFGATWTSPDWAFGQLSAELRVARLLEFTELVALGNTVGARSLEGTERGSPAKGWPETRTTFNLNWDQANWGATLGARYTSSLTESFQGALRDIDSVTYWDGQVRFTPPIWDEHEVTFALGVNNLFDEDTPGCFSCDVNNMDPNLYDVPGRFGYFRVSFEQ